MVRFKLFLQSLFQSLETLIRIIFFSSWKRMIREENQERGVFVLGNGPSLTSGIEEWKNEIDKWECAGVNLFSETDLYSQIKPKYYVINAPEHYMEANMDQEYFEMQKRLFTAIGSKTDWNLELFIPWPAKKFSKWKEYLGDNKNIRITYFNHTPAEGFVWFRNWVFNRNLGMPRPHNVLVPSIMLMILKGYKKIRLLGADHSWIQNITVADDNTVLVNQKHFYDTNTSRPEPMKKLGTGKRKLHEILLKFMLSFESYFIIKDYASSRKTHVTNCTRNSYIDAFDREFPVE